ncbi:hypothetical protein JST97_35480 [bacterium]|nr:hypothetical protein [bacterium]
MSYQLRMAQLALALQDSLSTEEDAEILQSEEADELTWDALELFAETLEMEIEGEQNQWTH